jgi:hypothetical protein
MKNKILISLLVVSFFNYIGCYSYSALTEEEINAGRPYPDEKSIILVLNDGSEVSCGSEFSTNSNELLRTNLNEYYYLRLDTPSRILIGSGDEINKNTKVKSAFEGIVLGEMIDSSRIFIVDSEEFCVYWTKDNRRLALKKGDYIDILPEQGTGYYIYKPYVLERKIAFEDIKEIKGSSINWWVTGPFIALGVAAFIVFFLWAASYAHMFEKEK